LSFVLGRLVHPALVRRARAGAERVFVGTHRRLGSAFAVVTGHECAGGSHLDWTALARMPVLIVLMGHRTLGTIAARLVAHGAAPQTPAAVVSQGTTPGQRVVIASLTTIGKAAATAGLNPPYVPVIGEVVCLARALEWFVPALANAASLGGNTRLLAIQRRTPARG
jgi:siroheme synthase